MATLFWTLDILLPEDLPFSGHNKFYVQPFSLYMFFISREVAINLFIEGVRVMQRTEIKRGMVLLLLLLVFIS